MCLNRLVKFPVKKTGYKVFRKTNGKLYGEFFAEYKDRPIGKLLKSIDFSPKSFGYTDGEKYAAAWHCFTSKKNAIKYNTWLHHLSDGKYVVAKVSIDNISATGYQDFFIRGKLISMPVVVAREMTIIEVYTKISQS